MTTVAHKGRFTASQTASVSQDRTVPGSSKRKAEELVDYNGIDDEDQYDEQLFSLLELETPAAHAPISKRPLSVEIGTPEDTEPVNPPLGTSSLQLLETRPRKALRRMTTSSATSPSSVPDPPVPWRQNIKAYLTGALFGVLLGGAGMLGALNSLPEETFQ